MPRSPLTPARRARLEKLATYLEGLPKRYRHFDMMDFFGDYFEANAIEKYMLENGGVDQCGTVACAIGHGPAAGILATKRMIVPGWRGNRVDWEAYSALFVGNREGNYRSDKLFDWLFDSSWKRVDNHHYGAAARIRFILAGNAVPDDFLSASSRHRALYAPYRIDAKERAVAE